MYTILWAGVFTILHLSFHKLVSLVIPKQYNALPATKRNELGTYVLSTLHHLVVVPYFTYAMISDFSQYSGSDFRFPDNHFDSIYVADGILTFSLGFFLGDLCGYYVPRLLSHADPGYLYIFHHFLAMFALVYFRSLSGALLLALHLTLLMETSTIFFNTAWMCRCLCGSFMPPIIITLLEYTFAVTFFLFRIAHVCMFLSHHWATVQQESISFLACVALGMALQFFWFFKIVKSTLFRRSRTGASGKNKTKL